MALARRSVIALLVALAHAPRGAHAEATARRPAPDLGALEPPSAPAARAAHLALWPARFIVDTLVAAPVMRLAEASERGDWTLRPFVLAGEEPRVIVAPTATLDLGRRSLVGVFYEHHDLAARGLSLLAVAETGGVDALSLSTSLEHQSRGGLTSSLSLAAEKRADHPFFGLGARSLPEAEARYGATRLAARASIAVPLGARATLSAALGARHVSLFDGCCSAPGVGELVEQQLAEAPPRWAERYTLSTQRLGITMHTAPGELSGDALAFAENAVEFGYLPPTRFIRWGLEARGLVAVPRSDHRLSAALQAHFVDPLGSLQTPFTELARIGGEGPLRGFIEGRGHDRSLFALTLGHRYPIARGLETRLELAAGNVLGPHLAGLSPGLLRLSAAASLASRGDGPRRFELTLGLGTETFDDGLRTESLRLLVGGVFDRP